MPAKSNPTLIAGRYARALISLAGDAPAKGRAAKGSAAKLSDAERRKREDVIASDLNKLVQTIEAHSDLQNLMKSPTALRKDQEAVLSRLGEKMGLDPLTGKFVGLVASAGRAGLLSHMARAVQEQLAQARDEAVAQVTVARALDRENAKALKDELKKVFGPNVTMETVIDSRLIGGLTIKMKSRLLDASVAARLERMRLAMKGA